MDPVDLLSCEAYLPNAKLPEKHTESGFLGSSLLYGFFEGLS